MMAQYTANHISLPFLTRANIHLQAAQPEIKAARKPTISEVTGMDAALAKSPLIIPKKLLPGWG
jgi:hypothetical protein